jgi:predicted component of type VI protein secretion system
MGTYPIDPSTLNRSLEAAQDELVKALREQQAIQVRIFKLRNDILHLAALCGVEAEDSDNQFGITEAVRYVLAKEKRPVTVAQVEDVLKSTSFFDTSKYKNLAANIQTVMGRLVKANEVRPAGGKFFIWIGGIGPMPPIPASLMERIKKS